MLIITLYRIFYVCMSVLSRKMPEMFPRFFGYKIMLHKITF